MKHFFRFVRILTIVIFIIGLTYFAAYAQINTTGTGTSSSSQSARNCGNNFRCFVRALKNCVPAQANLSFDANMGVFGATVSYTYSYETRGLANRRCNLFQRIQQYDMTYTDQAINSMHERGITDEAIRQQELDLENAMMSSRGELCDARSGRNFVTMMNKVRRGTISASCDNVGGADQICRYGPRVTCRQVE